MTTNGYTYTTLPNYGTLCRYKDINDVWERLEAHCLNCGYSEADHDGESICCEVYYPAPYTKGFDKETLPLREWSEEEIDDWTDNHDDQENCKYREREGITYQYEYDDCGVLCRHNDRDGDWECCEAHCLNCGYPADNHDECCCGYEWKDAPYITNIPPPAERKWYKGEEEDEEVFGKCDECGMEGKFFGKEGDDWTCSACLYGGCDSDSEDELNAAIDASGNALY